MQGLSLGDAYRLFDYSPHDGIFTRKVSRGRWLAGQRIGTVDGKGYLHVNVNEKFIRLHRLAWFMFFGWPPEQAIDHRNNNKVDNRIANLRVATCHQNAGNIRPPRHNTSGLKGVYWNKAIDRWQVQIKIHGRQTGIGTCDDIRVGAAWYNYAARAHFGHFAKLNDIPGYGPICLQPKVERCLP